MRRPPRFTRAVHALASKAVIGGRRFCDVCWAKMPCQLDRRIPGRWGGNYSIWNVHFLCFDCHSKKTSLEIRLTAAVDETVWAEWFDLAYPLPTPPLALAYSNITVADYEYDNTAGRCWRASHDSVHQP